MRITKNSSSFFILLLAIFLSLHSNVHALEIRDLKEKEVSHQVQVKLENTQNHGYYISIKVGQLPTHQYFTFMIDTVSPLSWIPDSNCENCLFTNSYNNHYHCEKNSKTCFQDESKDYQLIYPRGSVHGYLGSELIAFAGLPVNTSINCSLVFAHNISTDFYRIQADGILGLGFKENSMQNNIIDDLYKEDLIKNKSFSIYLSNNYLAIDQDSRLIFGGYDPALTHENEPFQFTDIIKGSHSWSVQMDDMKIGDTSLFSSSKVAVLSTYFPDIGVPLGEMEKVLSMLEKQGIHCVQTSRFSNPMCRGHVEEIGKFPNITFTGKGFHLVLPGVAYATYITSIRESDEKVEGGYHIVLGFREYEETSSYSGKLILGADFLRYFYTFYDMDKQRIGFARAKDSWVKWKRSDLWAPVMIFGAIVFLSVSLLLLVIVYCKRLRRIREQSYHDLHHHHRHKDSYTQMVSL